ncbi:GerAB/ArcD/ProY family transporter [Paenibacillus sp. FSL W7-1287]|uniref:GerAB/ArcD/ProY family transporter n=1 Tax=Paenibacillus sp. FSL W7-1287 TaxID=2954538 RepID=UPI0030FCD9F2
MTTKVVTQKQIYKYFTIHIITTIIMFMIGIVLQQSGFSAPLGVLIGACIGIVITFLSIAFAKRRPDAFFVHYGADIVTRWLHYPLMAFIIMTNLLLVAINLWEIQDLLLQFYLTGTPSWIILGLCGLCISYMARYGIKSMFRAAEGMFYLSMITFIIIPYLVHSNMEWFLARGFATIASVKEAWPTAYHLGSIFGEASLILYIYPYISQATYTRKTTIRFTTLAALMVICHLIPILIVLGPDLAQNLNYPELDIIRLIKSGSYLETLDPIIIALWLVSIFIKLSFILFVISHMLSRILKLKYSKPLIYPICAFIIVSTICLAQSHTQFFSMHNGGVSTCVYISQLIPLLYYVIDVMRNRRQQMEEESL